MAEYIKRETLLGNLNNIRETYKGTRNFNAVSAVDNAIGEVKESPSADVRPERHGKWILLGEDPDLRPWQQRPYQCSCCGWKSKSSNFCSTCGAKMDGKDGESDE